MNTGTKIRTALRVAVSLNTAAISNVFLHGAFLLKADGQALMSYAYKHIPPDEPTES